MMSYHLYAVQTGRSSAPFRRSVSLNALNASNESLESFASAVSVSQPASLPRAAFGGRAPPSRAPITSAVNVMSELMANIDLHRPRPPVSQTFRPVMQSYDIGQVATNRASIPMASGDRPDGLLLETFSGQNSMTSVESWLKTLEVMTMGYSDGERFRIMCRHIVGEAVHWASEELIPNLADLTWEDIKILMKERFGGVRDNVMVAAIDRKRRPNESVVDYYNEKQRLLEEAKVVTEHQIALLSHGMPDEYRTALEALHPSTLREWLLTAQAIELSKNIDFNSAEQRYKRRSNEKRSESRTVAADKCTDRRLCAKRTKKSTELPDTPCRYCLRVDQKAYHWHRFCPLRRAGSPPSAGSSTTGSTPQLPHFRLI